MYVCIEKYVKVLISEVMAEPGHMCSFAHADIRSNETSYMLSC